MGNWFAKVMDLIEGKQEKRILMLGLDAAGKTTLLYQFKVGDVVHTIPTIGFNVEEVEYKNIKFTVFDVGGQQRLRPLWQHYYHGCDALIYLVDSNDQERFEEACEELHGIIGSMEFNPNAPVLIFSNKQDLPNSVNASKLADVLLLPKVKGRSWYIQPCIATNGTGLIEGFEWLRTQLNKK
jgi:small GTP-binding protein